MAEAVVEELGPVDFVAAFAGGSGMPVPTVQESASHWREVIEQVLSGVSDCAERVDYDGVTVTGLITTT